jgi:hypothetical protein
MEVPNRISKVQTKEGVSGQISVIIFGVLCFGTDGVWFRLK